METSAHQPAAQSALPGLPGLPGLPDSAGFGGSTAKAPGSPTGPNPTVGLTARDHAILQFSAHWWHDRSNRDEAIHRDLGLSPVEYFLRLNELIDRPAAEHEYAALIRRLRRIRENRRGALEARI